MIYSHLLQLGEATNIPETQLFVLHGSSLWKDKKNQQYNV